MPSEKCFYTEKFVDSTGKAVNKNLVQHSVALALDWDTKFAEKYEGNAWTDVPWSPHLETLAKKLQKFDKDCGGIEIYCESDELKKLLDGDTQQLYYVGFHNDTKVLQTVNL